MHYRKLKTLQQSLKLLKALKQLKTILQNDRTPDRKFEVKQWLDSYGDLMSKLSVEDLEVVREKAHYDKKEWENILSELKRALSE